MTHNAYNKAVLSQWEPRDAAVNFDTYRILQVSNGIFVYAKDGNLVDEGASAQNTLNHV